MGAKSNSRIGGLGWTFRRLRRVVGNRVMLNGVQGMVGESALVTKEIGGVHHPGSVRARGEEWLAVPLDPDDSIVIGTSVTVADVQRGLLVVYPELPE